MLSAGPRTPVLPAALGTRVQSLTSPLGLSYYSKIIEYGQRKTFRRTFPLIFSRWPWGHKVTGYSKPFTNRPFVAMVFLSLPWMSSRNRQQLRYKGLERWQTLDHTHLNLVPHSPKHGLVPDTVTITPSSALCLCFSISSKAFCIHQSQEGLGHRKDKNWASGPVGKDACHQS